MRETVLLLEDEILVALDIEQALEGAGFQVVAVTSNREAFAALDAARPDVVVVDIVLKGERSDAFTARLVADAIPFVVYSGDQRDLLVGTAFAQGQWVNKPAQAGELEEAVSAALQSRLADQAIAHLMNGFSSG